LELFSPSTSLPLAKIVDAPTAPSLFEAESRRFEYFARSRSGGGTSSGGWNCAGPDLTGHHGRDT
jgi:hypothetical protein